MTRGWAIFTHAMRPCVGGGVDVCPVLIVCHPYHPFYAYAQLLGRNSPDIDLALDNITGAAFADLIVRHVSAHNTDVRVSGVGLIKLNPAQSKHLETATFILHGLSVDAVGLRSETYTDSRIPETVTYACV